MLIFLFLLGGVLAWSQRVGGNDAGTWLARMDAGIRLIIFGQIFGGLLGFIPIVLINKLLEKRLFTKNE